MLGDDDESRYYLDLDWLNDKLEWLFCCKEFVVVPVQFGDKCGVTYKECTNQACLYLLEEQRDDFMWYMENQGLTLKHGCKVNQWELSYVS